MFVTKLRAASYDDRSPSGDFWFSDVGGRSLTGANVTADQALRLAAVFSCVRVLAESFAVLPFRLYRRGIDGRRQEPQGHWLTRLMRRPNRYQSAFEWREMMQGHMALRGNAYSEILEDGRGGVAELLPLHPGRVSVEALSNGSWRYVVKDQSGAERTLRRDRVFHLRGLSSDGIMGMSPIGLQRETIAGGLAAQEYGNRFFANDAKPTSGWIGTPDNVNFADKATREAYRESVQAAMTGANRHKILVLDRGMKYNEVGLTNRDSQFLESRGFTRSEIAGIFRVPPHMIGDLSRATFGNIEQQSIDFWQGTMLPWTERWEAAIVAQLLTEDEPLEVNFDFRNLMRGDATSRAAYIHSMVLDGVLTRNEGRDLEGYDPIDGLDEPLQPVNVRGIDDPEPDEAAGAQPPAKPAQGGADGAEDDDEGDDAQARRPAGKADERLALVLQAQAGRLARRAAGALARKPAADVFGAEFAGLLAESMGLPMPQAELTCRKLAASGAANEDQITRGLLACAGV